MKPIIFTDLDGTLLNHKDYTFIEALPALDLIRKQDIPLVMCTSKTRAEIEVLSEELENAHPFISENGGGIFIPRGYFPFPVKGENLEGYIAIILGRPYKEVREALHKIEESTGAKLKGFGDMSVEEVSRLTGLGLEGAALAMRRDFDEPFILDGDEGVGKKVTEEIENRGYCWTRGRLYHILGPHDKGAAVRILKGYFSTLYGKITTIGLGDSLNDAPLLREVDYPVLVKKSNGSYEPIYVPGLVRAEEVGPAGWNSKVLAILESIGYSQP